MMEVVGVDDNCCLTIYDFMDGTKKRYFVRVIISKGDFYYDEGLEDDYGSFESAVFYGKQEYYRIKEENNL